MFGTSCASAGSWKRTAGDVTKSSFDEFALFQSVFETSHSRKVVVCERLLSANKLHAELLGFFFPGANCVRAYDENVEKNPDPAHGSG